jgi:hypothetical protein
MNLSRVIKKPFYWILFLAQVSGAAAEWYRGNTHAHTVLCGHADSTPEVVTKWYHDHGYNFLILSEHNKFIDPKTVKMPDNKRTDFILIPGEEITGAHSVHTTAMNIDHLVSWKDEGVAEVHGVIENHIHRTKEAGGHAILNHPHGGSNLKAKDILPAKSLHMMEVYNASTKRNNIYKRKGLGYPLTAEGIWDELLTQGRLVYGVGSDDAHNLQSIGPNESNAGLGWVTVRAEVLTADAITAAMQNGDFYASNGVCLKTYEVDTETYTIEVDEQKTKEMLTSLPPWSGLSAETEVEGYRIDFFGPHGIILESVQGTKSTYKIESSAAYVRARVTLTRRNQDEGFQEHYAWGQPVFADH